MTRRTLGDERANWHAVANRAFGALAFVAAVFAAALVALALGA